MLTNQVLSESEGRMQGAITALEHEFATIRTGRASTDLVAHLPVNYYGSPTPLNQIATITVPEARSLAIQPWDPSALPEIEKAILRSDLNLTPNNDGTVIRLNFPLLTEERRRELVKLVGKRVEDAKVAVRNVRRDGNNKVQDMEKTKEVSQDEARTTRDHIQNLTDAFTEEMGRRERAKAAEVMEI
jgi:ribosome recycling factor